MKGAKLRGVKPKVVMCGGVWEVMHYTRTDTKRLIDTQVWAYQQNLKLGWEEKPWQLKVR